MLAVAQIFLISSKELIFNMFTTSIAARPYIAGPMTV